MSIKPSNGFPIAMLFVEKDGSVTVTDHHGILLPNKTVADMKKAIEPRGVTKRQYDRAVEESMGYEKNA